MRWLWPLVPLLTAGSPLASPVAGAPLHFTHEGTRVTMRQGKTVLWWRGIRGKPVYPMYKLSVPGLDVVGNVAYDAYCFEGERTSCGTAGFHKLTGQPLFDADGLPQAIGEGQMVTHFISHPAAMPFTGILGTRVDLLTGKAVKVSFPIRPRPGCGPLNISIGLTGRTTYDAQYAYAEQDDHCGVFVARFDWHGPATQTPRITAKDAASSRP